MTKKSEARIERDQKKKLDPIELDNLRQLHDGFLMQKGAAKLAIAEAQTAEEKFKNGVGKALQLMGAPLSSVLCLDCGVPRRQKQNPEGGMQPCPCVTS